MDNLEENLNNILISIFNNILMSEENSINNALDGDITITEIHTIEAIGIDEPKTMSQTANILGITLGTLTIAVRNLVQKGYVIRGKSDRDRRVVQIKLTEKGMNAYRVHKDFHAKTVSNMVKNLNRNEVLVLINSLKEIQRLYKLNNS